ncbi:MAG: sigma-70 family RNA polymerase sigma factor [Planctomycetes bacterium]|nr:sigma-70 family RNA polymerase sigma factor [Planctomycetota bacterium]
MDDRDLVSRAQAGEAEAAGALAQRYLDPIHAFARRWLGDPHEAEDATQETFLRAMRALREFRGEASFRTWLFRIATRACLDRRRDPAARQTPLPLEGVPEPAADARHGPRSARATRDPDPGLPPRMAAALAELPERQRLVLTLSVFHEMKPVEIAGVVESSVEAVRMNLSHARRRMRERLKKQGPGHGESSPSRPAPGA